MEGVLKLIIAGLAFVGFLIASYIHRTKKSSSPLVCPLEGSCEAVIHSDQSSLFGIPVELLGAIYYALMGTAYVFFFLFPSMLHELFPYSLLAVTAFAFLFSLYLTAIQAFVLKHWCTWCLFSAGICVMMFLITVIVLKEGLIKILGALIP
jgi:uncharacterized membrane protein